MPRRTMGTGAAAITVLALLIVVGLIAVAVRPPGWMQFALGALMAAGSASFAGLAAHALRPQDRGGGPPESPTREDPNQEPQSKRRTA